MTNKIRKYILSFALGIATLGMQAQTKWTTIDKKEMSEVLSRISEWYKNTSSYSLTVTHTSYENYTTTIPFEKRTGYFKKDKNNYHSNMLGFNTIQNENYKIVVDTSNNAILVSNPDKSIGNAYTLNDYERILNLCSEIKKSVGLNNETHFRLELKQGHNISYYEYIVDAEGFLKQMVWYYDKEVWKNVDDKNSEKGKPRLSVAFSGYTKNSTHAKNEFDASKFIIKKENKIVLTEKYKGFRLYDQRIVMN
jgi:hypothetical protein